MELIEIVEGESELMNHRQRQHAVGFAAASPLFLRAVQEGLSHLGALGLHEVHQHVNASQVGHPPGCIVAPHIPLLNRSTGTLLGAFDVVGADVFLRGHEALTLEMRHLIVEVGAQGCDKGEQGIRQVEQVGVNVHVDIVGTEQRFSSLAEVEVVGIEVGADLVDVA